MSFMKRTPILIGLICIVVGGVCLLDVRYQSESMSDRPETKVLAVVPPQATASAPAIPATATSSVGIASVTTEKLAAATLTATELDSAPMKYEVVTTPAAQEQGLGGRAVIPDNYAMLFVFPTDGMTGFWMKDMLTSIDMIWLTDNGTIAGIQNDATPESYPDVFYPPYPVRYVLETKVGLAKERGWTVGTKIALPLPYGK
jgi:uncharacterized membrane protein (UPF0127 family)